MKIPGSNWRLLAHSKNDQKDISFENEGIFDELVVDDWLHIEQMDTNVWWMRVGDARIVVRLKKGHRPMVTIDREEY